METFYSVNKWSFSVLNSSVPSIFFTTTPHYKNRTFLRHGPLHTNLTYLGT
jgi:hypothetical protein